jgi:hypothetical protein
MVPVTRTGDKPCQPGDTVFFTTVRAMVSARREAISPARPRPSGGVCLATALCDPDAELLSKASRLWPALSSRFDAFAIHVTTNNHPDWTAFLKDRGIPTRAAPPAWDQIGLHRRRSLAIALDHHPHQRILYIDPDHVLRWVERKPEELDTMLELVGCWDCLIVGRSPRAFQLAPDRLRKTEAIVNRIYALMTGREWDIMMAARGFSRDAAALIVSTSTENTIGNDTAWPLAIERAGLSMGYLEADGLIYETNAVYANDLVDVEDGDPEAWMLRVYTANQHIDAMRPFLKPDRN